MVGAPARALEGPENDLGQILHEYKVPPGSGDETPLPLLQAPIKDGQRPRNVAGTDHVGQAQGNMVQPGDLQVVLRRRFGNGVAGVGREFWMSQGDGVVQRLGPVAEGGLKVDEPSDSPIQRGPDEVGPADTVGQGVVVKITGILVGGGGVNHRVGAEFRKKTVHQAAIRDGPLHKAQAGMRARQMFPPAGGKVVHG